MTQPHPQHEINMEWALSRSAETESFTLSPELWRGLSLTQQLEWTRVKFEPTSATYVPNNLIGVYSFVLEPGIAGIDLRYLLYVGMTRQHFRARFRKYLRHQTEYPTNRRRVQVMLQTWPEHLYFYYAPLADREIVKSVEDELIIAFKPPVPREYPARIRERFSLLDILQSRG